MSSLSGSHRQNIQLTPQQEMLTLTLPSSLRLVVPDREAGDLWRVRGARL